MKNLLIKLNAVIEFIEKCIITLSISTIMINSTANAIGRYFFNRSIFFSEEINQFLIVVVTFIGFSYAVRKGRNIRMTALYDSMKLKHKKILSTIIALSSSITIFYLCYLSYFYIIDLKTINRLSSALQFPVYIVYSIIPIGFFIAAVQYLLCFIQNISSNEIYVSFDIIEGEEGANKL